ncbi:MAG: hypothetical protein M1837_005501 [Sclerophora amabilis]|nr:MAG: hypothetical protein M1837_005501 [Sclerophora amabilis]
MSASSTNIRVFVQWSEPTVFAGETVECKITFKNVAPTQESADAARQTSKLNGFAPGGERQRKTAPLQASAMGARQVPTQSPRAPLSLSRGHRPALSLNLPPASGPRHTSSVSSAGRQHGVTTPGRTHVRSVSIMSMGGSDAGGDRSQSSAQPLSGPARRPGRSHARSASLQVIPRRTGALNGSTHPSGETVFIVSSNHSGVTVLSILGQRSYTQPSPLYNTTSAPLTQASQNNTEYPFPSRFSRRITGVTSVPSTPGVPRSQRTPAGSLSQNFKFPQTAFHPNSPSFVEVHTPPDSATATNVPAKGQFSRTTEENGSVTDHLAPSAKVLSASSLNGGTPRSSGDFYSLSNNSTETLASEYNHQISNRLLQRPQPSRRISNLTTASTSNSPETLMMGYAQISGSFTLDGSLVNQAPFEEVKRKGVVGSQGGGGVVGVETKKRDSGLLGSFGWGNLGESIGGFLGSGEMSSIKEMRGIANSKTIPLLSTPRSILFVDLRLAPGESKSYTYKFPLPIGLPPSHRGKAIKTSYTLVIGTQRPATGRGQQQVKHVNVPFRVFSGVNGMSRPHFSLLFIALNPSNYGIGRGEVLGHDLMSPHILLKDQALTVGWSETSPTTPAKDSKESTKRPTSPKSSSQDFLSYVDSLLKRPRQNSSAGLLSPTHVEPNRGSSFVEEASSVKEAIDLAILRSNLSQSSAHSNNRYDIARSGRRVAVVLLPRPAFRLGETITTIIDFSMAHIPCYAIHATLETSEKVDPTISLRSEASIYRVSRRTHATQSESTLFARRVIFSPTIPINATPEFITSGVGLGWKLRIEFVTPRMTGEEEDESNATELLEEVSQDDRGQIMAAVEGLRCESFEITVPLKVYGAAPSGVSNKDEPTTTEGFIV